MPLKLYRRNDAGAFYVRGTVRGQSVYETTSTTDPERAEGYRIALEKELWDRSVYGARAVISFAAAAESYLSKEDHTPTTRRAVAGLYQYFKAYPLAKISQEALDGAYEAILTKGRESSSATKIRHVLTPLRAILEHGAIRKWCDRPAFETPSVPRTKTHFLRPEQATALLLGAAEHIQSLLIFLIGTGVRMSEALELDWSMVDLRGARAVVWQKQDNERHIDLPPAVVTALDALPGREGRVFRPVRSRRPKGALGGKEIGEGYMDTGRSGGGQIKAAWSGACKRAGLPGTVREWTPIGQKTSRRFFVPEVTPHDLRHTWATWQYCVHKDLLKLKDDGGWSTITMVTRYAKKMPDAYRTEIMAWLEGSFFPVLNACNTASAEKRKKTATITF